MLPLLRTSQRVEGGSLASSYFESAQCETPTLLFRFLLDYADGEKGSVTLSQLFLQVSYNLGGGGGGGGVNINFNILNFVV